MGRYEVMFDGVPTSGSLQLDGGKHSFAHVLPILALAEEVVIHKVPNHTDAQALINVIHICFADVRYSSAEKMLMFRNRKHERRITLNTALTSMSRSLYGMLPAILLSADYVVLEGAPQGCDIGARPSDWYLSILKSFGVNIEETSEGLTLSWPVRHSATLTFEYPTMTGTVIAIAAASASLGNTLIRNGSVEPSCKEMLRCLAAMGGYSRGTLPNIEINGGHYDQASWRVSPDRIHAVTYLTAGLLTMGTVSVSSHTDIDIPRFVDFLRSSGVTVADDGHSITAAYNGAASLKSVQIDAGSEPLFSSDWVPFAALLIAVHGKGGSSISDDVFLRRFQFLTNLQAFGLTNVRSSTTMVRGRTATLVTIGSGIRSLAPGNYGLCPDIRGSAALLLAGLVSGYCSLEDDHHVRRGYTDVARDLRTISNGHITVSRH